MAWDVGPLPALQTLWDKEPFYRHGGIQKERVIVSRAGRRRWAINVSDSDAPAARHGSLVQPLQDFDPGGSYSSD